MSHCCQPEEAVLTLHLHSNALRNMCLWLAGRGGGGGGGGGIRPPWVQSVRGCVVWRQFKTSQFEVSLLCIISMCQQLTTMKHLLPLEQTTATYSPLPAPIAVTFPSLSLCLLPVFRPPIPRLPALLNSCHGLTTHLWLSSESLLRFIGSSPSTTG